MAALKHSRQREAIKDFLGGRKDHPTAEMVYSSLRAEYPQLSLGTVYRNLALLTEIGEVKRIIIPDGPDHYDRDVSNHHHFVCRCCQQVSDIQTEAVNSGIDQIIPDVPGQVESYSLNFFGVCERCLSAKEGTA